MFEVKVDEKRIKEAQILLGEAEKKIPKIIMFALNRATTMTRVYQGRLARQGYNIPAKVIAGRTRVHKASATSLEAAISNSRKRVALENFKINLKKPDHYKRKITVSVVRGKATEVPGLFWGNYLKNTSKLGLYMRKGSARETLERAYGPSVYQMVTTQDLIAKEIGEYAQEKFTERFEHEFMRGLRMK